MGGGGVTVVAAPDVAAVDDGFPDEELVVGERAEALDAALVFGFDVCPGFEFFEEAAGGVAGEGGWGHGWARARVALGV